MRLSFKFLLESKCQNIWHDMLRAGKQVGASVEVPDAIAQRILDACGLEAPPVTVTRTKLAPVPYDQWPLRFRLLAKLATPQDAGLGDVVERIVGPVGGSAFKKWFKLATRRDCGCNQRIQTWNELYPLPANPPGKPLQ
jgi:hypothetical protein